MSTTTTTEIIGAELACACGSLADEKQATEITILDLRGLSQLCDFFVICSASSEPHLKAIREQILAGLTEKGVKTHHKDGGAESHWMILDFIDVIMHVFHHERREHYSLEDLWADAPRIDWKTGDVVVEDASQAEDED